LQYFFSKKKKEHKNKKGQSKGGRTFPAFASLSSHNTRILDPHSDRFRNAATI